MILNFIFLLCIFTIIILLFIPQSKLYYFRTLSLISSGLILINSLIIFILFNKNDLNFQFLININDLNISLLNLDFIFGLDGISIYFFVLTSFLLFLCVLFVWNEINIKFYVILLFIVEFLLLLTFSTLNLFLFYVFFECILIPMYLMIGVWGSREKKIRAAYLLVFYTICGSILMLVSLIYIYNTKGTFNLEYLMYSGFSLEEQLLLWVAFFLSFASKIPMFPFHIWLPEAHVEAPTVGSVLLAGLLLKLGVFGFLRYSLTLFPEACFFFSPFVYTLSLIGVIYSSFNAIKQTDLKKIIAYSSIAHMNLVVLGIFSYSISGIEGAIIQSVSHGFVASGLFFLIGILYSRYHSRLLYYYTGLVHIMPLYSSFMLFFILSNIALPGTGSFIGEFLLLNSIFQNNVYCSLLAGTSVILSGAYSLWLYNRIIFGNFKSQFINSYKDLSLKELIILIFLIIPSLLLGLIPSFFLNYLHSSVLKLFVISNILFI